MPEPPRDKVAIAIATCGRPRSLGFLLESLSRLRLIRNPRTEVRVIVVDNHPQEEGRDIVAAWEGRLPFPITYQVERRRGIATARNRLVQLAAGCDFIAFIDDDETASTDWLDELLEARKQFNADIVQGATHSRYEDPPAWLKEGRFFEMRRFPHGQELDEAYTFNVLVSTKALMAIAGPFDERFNLSGGEDIFLFRQLRRRGARIVYSARALTEEIRPRSRTTLGWYCRRAYRIGNTNVLVDRHFRNAFAWLCKWIGYALGRFGQGSLLLIRGIVAGRATTVRALLSFCLGAGNISGLLNLKYYEYRRLY